MDATTALLWKNIQIHVGFTGRDVDSDPGPMTARAIAAKFGLLNEPLKAPVVPTAPADRLGAEIVRQSRRFVGLMETVDNRKWDNPATPGSDDALMAEMVASMRPGPWQPGWAYCLAWAEAMVRLSGQSLGFQALTHFFDLCTPHCMTTYRAFQKRGLISAPSEMSSWPPGSIVLCQHGTSDSGHAMVLVRQERSSITTIEGNTTATGASREAFGKGDGVFAKSRHLFQNGNLITKGAITPAAMLAA